MRKPKLPKKLTPESVRKYKERCRKWDQWRIDNGIATPEEIQKENSLIPLGTCPQIVSFSDMIDI